MSLCVCATARKVIFEAELKSVVQFLKLQKHNKSWSTRVFFYFFSRFFDQEVSSRGFSMFLVKTLVASQALSSAYLVTLLAWLGWISLQMYQTARRRWELDWGNQRFQVNE
jgi:membrane-associated protease RseP (regulator of RpoE activity)